MLVVAQEGAEVMLGALAGWGTVGLPEIHLMGTAGTPLHTWTLADYLALELPLTGGYSPQTIPASGAGWSTSVLSAGARLTSIVLTWTFTTGLTVFGWFAKFTGFSLAWGGEEFSPAFTFGSGGGTFTWFLPLDLTSCPGVSAC
jgi:hypothetical protein